MSTFFSPNLNVMVKAAQKAARSLVRDFGEVEKLQVSRKGPGDFVSRADIRAEEIIMENLLADRPDYGFVREEGPAIVGADSRMQWIIDPLDGTTNFLHGLPHWAINIALAKDGEVMAALTYDPIKDEMFRAEKGQGTFMNNSRLRASGRRDLAEALIAVGIAGRKAKFAEKAAGQIAKVHSVVADTRRTGSAALDMAYVAAGRLDAYFELNTKPWDIAAGVLLVREAAGSVQNLSAKTDVVKHALANGAVDILCGNADIVRALQPLLVD